MKKLSEILTGPDTWCQGRWVDGSGRVCLVQALARLHGIGDPLGDEPIGDHLEYARLRRIIEADFGRLVQTISAWNDEDGRSWADIARVTRAYDRDRVLNP